MTGETDNRLAGIALPARFNVVRRIGSGANGVVFEAIDRETNSRVALKYLSHVGPNALYRFKREFRSLADITHPNLVQLYELLAHDERWFFTMELIDGSPLPVALGLTDGSRLSPTLPEAAGTRISRDAPPKRRVGGERLEPEHIRGIFRQLAQGVHALHASGKLHRDLKCSNVRITQDGRAKVLDFGLVDDVEADGMGSQARTGGIVGTPLYMAPEQCIGAPIEKSADWYALGVMLFRALTGAFPFDGPMVELMHAKQTRPPPAPGDLVDGLPEDLASLCSGLLQRNAKQRPRGREVLERLGAERPAPEAVPSSSHPDFFVGREAELVELREAFEESRLGPVAVFVHGESGMGRSALVHRFVRHEVGRRRTTVLLTGRCFDRETLPYKALDGLIDSLGHYLVSLSQHEATALVPRHVADLVQLFPVLRRVPVFDQETDGRSVIPDLQERQRRAFLALRELLAKIANRRPLLLFVDDLHRGDRASAEVLTRIMQPPDAPAVLFIGAYRTDEAASSAFLGAFHSRAEADGLSVRRIEVGALAQEDAAQLAARLVSDQGGTQALAEHMAREAHGSPLFIDLLSRRARDAGPERGDPEHEHVSLSDVVWTRVLSLDDEGRRLLELLAVSGRPLRTTVGVEALGLSRLPPGLLGQLQGARLARTRGAEGAEEIECYHDRIREAVLGHVGRTKEAEYHSALADALRESGDADPELLAAHYEAAGRRGAAFEHALRAAKRAGATLAFARAARLYRQALSLHDGSRSDGFGLRVALAEAHEHAGHGPEAAKAYDEAAIDAPSDRSLELRRRAAEQYLFSGHLDEGRALLDDVLRGVGLQLPRTPALAVASFAARRAQLRLRGMRYRKRPWDEVDPALRLKIDTCWSVAIGLAMIDPVRAGAFQALHLLLALEAGDEARIAKAVAVEATFCATAGGKNRRRTERFERLARELSSRVDDPFVHALTSSCIGGAAWLEGRWQAALSGQERADSILRRECTGVAWHLATTNIVMLDALYRMGRWSDLFDRHPGIVDDAHSRGDLFLEIYLRIKFVTLQHLAADAPDAAEQELDGAIRRWSAREFNLLHFWHHVQRCEIDLYIGRPDRAATRFEARRPEIRRSLLLRLQMYRITSADLRARILLALTVGAEGRQKRRMLKEIAGIARGLRKERSGWADTLANLIEASVAMQRGDRERAAASLEDAARAADSAGMELHAAVARLRRGQLLGMDGVELVEAGEGRLRAERITRCDRWATVLVPGAWR